MDQAITTLRIAWQRRALFLRPLALPLAAAALVTFFELEISLALLAPMGVPLDPSSLGRRLWFTVALNAPLWICKTLAVAMIVAVAADTSSARRWLPTPCELSLAAAMTVAALVAVAAVDVASDALLGALMRMSGDTPLFEPGARLAVFVVRGLAWPWAAAAVACVATARLAFPATPPRPALRGGRVVIAVLLVLASVLVVNRFGRMLLQHVYRSLLGDDPFWPIGISSLQLFDATATAAGIAVVVPVIAMAIAMAAFAGRDAARPTIAGHPGDSRRAS